MVEQVDRDAAAKFMLEQGHWAMKEYHAKHIRLGDNDDQPLVQAFAAHRIAALEEAAGVCEALGRERGKMADAAENNATYLAEVERENQARCIAAAIRAVLYCQDQENKERRLLAATRYAWDQYE